MVSPWRNRLARSAVNSELGNQAWYRKVGGSSPPGDASVFFFSFFFSFKQNLYSNTSFHLYF